MDVYQRRRLVALSAIAAVFIFIVLLVRSCGGDEEEPTAALTAPVSGATGAGGVLTKDDYIAQADDICLQANTSLAEVDETDAQQAASDKGEILSGQLEQLQTLAPPEEDTDALNKFLKALGKEVEAYADQATAAERGDDATVAELDTTITEFADKAQSAAEDYGFDVCGDTSQVDEDGDGGDDSTDTTTDDTGAVVPETTTTTETPATTETSTPTDEGGTAAPTTETPAPTDESDSSSGGVTP